MQLKLTDLVKRYHGQTALDGISLELAEVRSLVLIGPSGGGKSTLLRVLAGLELPDQGSVQVDGDPVPSDEVLLIRYRRRIGTVFQAYNLFPHLSALDNITLPLIRAHGQGRSEAQEYAMGLLRRFQLEAHAQKMPMELSGGQQQRVAIIRAIAIKPRFLLLDEPTSALDPEMTAEVLDLIAELKTEGRELILVTHNMGFARRVADHCLFLSDGKLLETGTADRLFNEPRSHELQSFLSRVLKY